MTDQRSETTLISRARKGDQAAFGTIANSYRLRLAGVIRDRLGEQLRGQVEIDDILQETFLRAYGALDRFDSRGEGALFRWLSGIAVNVIREEAKRSRTIPGTGSEREREDQATSQFTSLRRAERYDRLADAIKTLPDDYQRVIRLTRFEKLPPEEIARRMNRSRQAVRNLLLRALRALKEAFGDTESLHLPPRPFQEEDCSG